MGALGQRGTCTVDRRGHCCKVSTGQEGRGMRALGQRGTCTVDRRDV